MYEYYLINPFSELPDQVSELEFDTLIINYRNLYTMEYDKEDINRQNFYDSLGYLVAFRIKKK